MRAARSRARARRSRWPTTARSGPLCGGCLRGRLGRCCSKGGAAVYAAAWDEGLVDYVRLYVTPHVLGPDGLPLLPERSFSSAELRERRIVPLGPDVMIEGYVHGTR